MANKRILKKAINYVASDLFLECIVLKQIKRPTVLRPTRYWRTSSACKMSSWRVPDIPNLAA